MPLLRARISIDLERQIKKVVVTFHILPNNFL